MKLFINGEEREFEENSTIEDILQKLSIRDKVMATAVNMEIVKEANWKEFIPKDGDNLELLQFVGGG
jgi:sulfur carrier protein